MSEAEQFRAAVRSVLAEPVGFLATAEGAATLEVLQHRVGKPVMSMARRYGHAFDSPLDAAVQVLVWLIDHPRLCQGMVETAEDPFKYMWREIITWTADLAGRRGPLQRMDTLDNPAIAQSLGATPRPAFGCDPVADAVALTVATLLPKTPLLRRELVPDLVGWLAQNPAERHSYEAVELHAASDRFPELLPVEVSSVANIAWGARNRGAETSLLGWFLRTPHLPVKSSPTHLTALVQYQRRMAAASPVLHIV